MSKLFSILIGYLLRKSFIERFIFLCLFLACLYVLIGYFEYEEKSITQRYHTDLSSLQKDIVALFHKYQIQSKCNKPICTTQETQLLLHTPNYQEPKDKYYSFLTCSGLSCYEFVRELENLAQVFITDIRAFNVEILHSPESSIASHTQQESILTFAKLIDKIQDSTQDSKNPPIAWQQDMQIIFEIEKIGI